MNTELFDFVAHNVILNYYINKKGPNLNENSPKREQNHAKYHVFTQNFKRRVLIVIWVLKHLVGVKMVVFTNMRCF